jgi:PPOX class probable F420-dependent enzyme
VHHAEQQTPTTGEDDLVTLLKQLTDEGRQHVEGRLHSNLMIWLTTVSQSGRPDSVAVWFLLREDETLLMYSQPGKPKLRNIRANPNVALGLDVTDIGRDVIRLAGLAHHDPTVPPAHRHPAYVAKYAERIGALFGTPERFGELFSSPIVITPTRIWTPSGNPRALT